jgi:hypothetical protein
MNERPSIFERLVANFVLDVVLACVPDRHEHVWTAHEWWWVCDICRSESLLVRNDESATS